MRPTREGMGREAAGQFTLSRHGTEDCVLAMVRSIGKISRDGQADNTFQTRRDEYHIPFRGYGMHVRRWCRPLA